MDCIEVVDLRLVQVNSFGFSRPSDRNLRVQDHFKLVSDVFSVDFSETEAKAGELAHIAVRLTEQIVILCNLEHHQPQKEFPIVGKPCAALNLSGIGVQREKRVH